MLLARQHQFGRRQRVGQLPRLLGHPRGVDRDEARPQHQRHPDARDIEKGQIQRLPGMPGQGKMLEGENRRGAHHQQHEPQGPLPGQGHGGDHDRRQKQAGEGVGEAPREIEQTRELDDVVGQQREGGPVAQPLAERKPQAQKHVQPGGGRNDEETQGDRKIKTENEPGDQHRRRLARDRQPAQPHQRVEAQAPGVTAQINIGEIHIGRNLHLTIDLSSAQLICDGPREGLIQGGDYVAKRITMA